MSTTAPPPRPRQVTWAGWMVILGSVLTVLTAWEVVSGIRSLETREAIEAFLDDPPARGLGLDVEGAIQLWRLAAMVSAGCATAAAVLGWHVLRRHHGARIGLAVLALPMFLSGLATGGFLSSLVVVASVMLWISPAREWFAGKPLPETAGSRRPEQRRDAGVDPWGAPRTPPPSAERTASEDATPYAAAQPPPSEHAFATAPTRPGPAAPTARPGAVVTAAVVTWVVAGIVLLVSGITVIAMAAAGDLLLEEMERQQPGLVADSGVSHDTLAASVVVMGVVLCLASIAAMVLAGFALRRREWARRSLQVLALVTAVGGVVASLATFAAVLPAFGAILVAALLRRPETRAWFAAAPGEDPGRG